ncbi:SDR family NAD(P)-dependent oxidoreductase [Vibrio coralliilyticus]|jgi:NAD(P)-dependent dehydrogenase (short-subunit alcohol dehydrogenase family)|uniref:SDR family NAD(P)-dependent oxidoreductase n=1 Tax=Vibrio coralliilyticus TaxID=190893 RepID=UPI000BAC2907|nr:SDR family oxidoreductase [Vibrio coralliilyticus]NOI76017.1 SDR family oxidoreductase [Vibrio coralliilyticus]PAW03945.1 bacilysin biosynthesis protein BacC [Vibrio coralliilyticus]
MDFHNKVAIVTGGSTGIGHATSEQLISRGAKVYNLDVQSQQDSLAHFMPCDVKHYEQIQSAIAEILKIEGQIDLLFANAGIHLFANLEQTEPQEFENVISTNIGGVFYTLKEVLPVMRKQKSGKVLLMGSDQSIVGKGSSSVYGLTKGAIGQLTKSTAIDYAQYNIQVNCICPGTIETPLLEKALCTFHQLSGEKHADIRQQLEHAQPIKRIAKPEEVANLACYLLSEQNSFMTGSIVPIDGGYSCQ